MKPKTITEKTNLHPRNLDRFGYNFEELIKENPELKNFVAINEHQIETIDFSNPDAVKSLNKALLIHHYDIQDWDIPENYLCPPIPGRADYIHYIADLLASSNNGIIPEGETVQGLDIGIGANCIYPLIGNSAYGWSFVGTDIDENAIQNCKKIIAANPKLMDPISLQLQTESRFIFKNIITPEDNFTFTICNPPFHASQDEATKSSVRKINNLENTKTTTRGGAERSAAKPVLNFGGHNAELWCEGGELGFVTQMIYESAKYPMQCLWFTTLVSKQSHLSSLYKTLNKVNAATVKTIDMAQGQKTSRIVAWTFMSEAQQKAWKF
ncbi:23S rRNA (adenine1618-N6)-methyltransferase [Flavobacterium sp. CG_23.5]|uniref:23S rRNA (adenine(1618)-N(6))-methyltransferase RlmF n=1 Tax=unclassified Flavobacterium TaxID=196869 RepID=UPI0018C9E85A|nr:MULTISPECIES: 23S rRNA (adenine(1618)-N(6))-methyltransferase RlmF [unclassified Flavobacterium]MBG6111433.1 23S rRNA (adenine1618-N6)-methyltransferase [Flavobacterium sp. CG_9.10]MBP2282724.1 23S rRNA (adenine1618-N6)-methyltransferase [Flavobacterium sp. CG_23.5]